MHLYRDAVTTVVRGRNSAYRAGIARGLLGMALMGVVPAAHARPITFRSIVSDLAPTPRGLVVAAGKDVVLLNAQAPRRIRWRYRESAHGEVDFTKPFADGDVLVVGQRLRLHGLASDLSVSRVAGRNGRKRWEWILPATGQDYNTPRASTIDGAGNVFVVPYSYPIESSEFSEFTVIKLAGADGVELWRTSVPGLTAGETDWPFVPFVTTDTNGDVIATARREDLDFYSVVKLSGATGHLVWRTDLPASWEEVATSVGSDGDVLLAFTGGGPPLVSPTGKNPAGLAKLASADGTPRWVAIPSGGKDIEFPKRFSAITERDGDIFAAGTKFTGDLSAPASSFTVSRFDGSTGAVKWTYSEAGDGGEASVMAFDAAGRLVVGGYVANALSCNDGFVITLDAASGTSVASETFDGTFSTLNCHPDCQPMRECPSVDDDSVYLIARDADGSIEFAVVLTQGGRHAVARFQIRRITLPH